MKTRAKSLAACRHLVLRIGPLCGPLSLQPCLHCFNISVDCWCPWLSNTSTPGVLTMVNSFLSHLLSFLLSIHKFSQAGMIGAHTVTSEKEGGGMVPPWDSPCLWAQSQCCMAAGLNTGQTCELDQGAAVGPCDGVQPPGQHIPLLTPS